YAAAVDEVLAAAGNGEVLAARLAEIAGAEPAVRRKRLCRFSRIVQITGKKRRTANLQLALTGEPHLGSGARPARARRRHFERIARARVEAGLQLGHAPELRHRAARQLLGEIPDEGRRCDGSRHDRELERGPVVALERTR